jgi:hypothetical protein
MYENAFSLMDLIQIAAIVFVCWFCYRSGFKNGTFSTLKQLEAAGVVTLQQEEENEEE